jgi:hypothetical protein
VVGVVAMAEIEPCDVHADFDEGLHHLVGASGRTKGTDDLSASTHVW